MYPAVSVSGGSGSSSTSNQQHRIGSSPSERPSTRRGRQSQSGESGGGDRGFADAQNGRNRVDIWTQKGDNRQHRSSATSSSASSSSTDGEILPENEQNPRGNGKRYPELSEPERYSTDQFESEEENGKEAEKGQKGAEKEDDFGKRLRDLASQRTRSLHESLQQVAAKRSSMDGANDVPRPFVPANNARQSSTSSSSSTTKTSSSETAEGAGGIGSRRASAASSARSSSSGLSAGQRPNLLSGNGDGKLNGNLGELEEKSAIGQDDNGMAEGPVPAPRVTPPAPFVSRLAAIMAQPMKEQKEDEITRKMDTKGRGGWHGAEDNPQERPISDSKTEEGGRRWEAKGKLEAKNDRTPLGFGSSSSRNFILSASGRTAPTKDQKERRSGSVAETSSRRGTGDSATYKAWLSQKMAFEREKRKKEEEKKAEEEAKRAEKKRVAEINFDRWKQELDKRMGKRKQAEKRKEEVRAERKKRAEEEKRANAEKTFEHWKRTEEQRLRSERERTRSVAERRKAEEQRRAERKRAEAEEAFREWLNEQNQRKRDRQRTEQERMQRTDQERREQAEQRRKIAEEAYGLWLRMKDEERRYTQSLAFRILDFESQAAQRWSSTPWLPTSPSTPSKLHRPPPELANGRRRTLEPRLVLPHSQRTSTAGGTGGGRLSSAVVDGKNGKGTAVVRSHSVQGRRSWR